MVACPSISFTASSITRLVELADPNCATKTSSSVTWQASTSLQSHGKQLLPIATDGVPLWVLVIYCQPQATQKKWRSAELIVDNDGMDHDDERTQHRSKTKVWLTGVQECEPLSWQAKYKNWVPILFIFRYSAPFWLSVSYCFLGVFGSFWPVIFRWFWVLVYRNPHPDTLSFLNFFLNFGEGPPTVASGPLSVTFSGLAKSSSYATGLQLIFPESFFTRLH